jgi:hypothetical protein
MGVSSVTRWVKHFKDGKTDIRQDRRTVRNCPGDDGDFGISRWVPRLLACLQSYTK